MLCLLCKNASKRVILHRFCCCCAMMGHFRPITMYFRRTQRACFHNQPETNRLRKLRDQGQILFLPFKLARIVQKKCACKKWAFLSASLDKRGRTFADGISYSLRFLLVSKRKNCSRISYKKVGM